MSPFKLTKDGKGLLEYGNNSLTAQQETHYTDRASKQLAEDIFAKNRAEYDFNRGKVPESKSERTKITEAPAVPKRANRYDRWSIVDIPPELQNTVFAPFIRDYYETSPPSLRDYINRSYLPWNQVLGIDREAMERKLKALLDRVKQQGNIEWMEWCYLPLPQHVIYRERQRGERGLMFEDLVASVSSKQMDEEVRGEEQEKLRVACERKERELEEMKEALRQKEKEMAAK